MSTVPASRPYAPELPAGAAPAGPGALTLAATLARAFPGLGYVLLLLGALLAPFASLRLRGSISWGEAFLMASALPLLGDLLSRRTRLWLPWWLIVAITAFGLGLALHAWPAGNIAAEDLAWAMDMAFGVFIVPVLVASLYVNRHSQVRALVLAWLGANLVNALIGVLQHQGVNLLWLQQHVHSSGPRVAALTLHPNSLAFFSAVSTALCLALALGAKRLSGFAAGLCACAVSFYAIDLAGSRTGLVVAVLSCAFVVAMFWLYQRGDRAILRYIQLVVVLLIAAALWQYVSGHANTAIARLLGERTASTSVADAVRAYLFEMSSQAFWSAPVAGTGYQNLVDAHSTWMSALACGGLLGLVAMLARDLGACWYALRLLRSGVAHRPSFAMSLGLVAVLVAMLLEGLREATQIHFNIQLGIGLLVLATLHPAPRHGATPWPADSVPGPRHEAGRA